MADPKPLSDAQMDLMTRGRCPDCGHHSAFVPGPRGGGALNVACCYCGAEFIIGGLFEGHVVMANRNSERGTPDPERLRTVFGIVLP